MKEPIKQWKQKSREEKSIAQERDERVEKYLSLVLDKHMYSESFAEAALTYCIQKSSRSADRLSRRIFWLNVTLVVIGTLALLAAGHGIFYK